MIWSRQQRAALAVLSLIACGFLAVHWAINRSRISNPQPSMPQRYSELADRIDPNMASWSELASLPSLGEKVAREIVSYRQEFQRVNPNRPAFGRAEDLEKVKGIGPATVANLRPYLCFPSLPATVP